MLKTLLLVLILPCISTWKLRILTNPRCAGSGCQLDDFNYVRAAADNESIHLLFGVRNGSAPSILAIHSRFPQAELEINQKAITGSTSGGAISIPGVTQSYGLVFADLMELEETEGVEDMVAEGQKNRMLHYFSNWDWTMYATNREIIYTAKSEGALFSSNGSITLKFPLEPQAFAVPNQPLSLSIPFELSLNNLRLGGSRTRLGIQLAIVSNMTVLIGHDYPAAIETINEIQTLVVDLHGRIASKSLSGYRLMAAHDKPSGWLQGEMICFSSRPTETQHRMQASMSRHMAHRKALRKKLRNSMPFLFYGPRIRQNLAPIPSIEKVMQLWHTGKHQFVPIGLRLQNFVFGTKGERLFDAKNTISWQGRFGIDSLNEENHSMTSPYTEVRLSDSTLPLHQSDHRDFSIATSRHVVLATSLTTSVLILLVILTTILICSLARKPPSSAEADGYKTLDMAADTHAIF